jgi:cysteine desulfurase
MEPAPIYLDHNATTPLDPRVFEAMRPWLALHVGNAASPHAAGQRASAAVEAARGEVAAVLGAEPRELLWTSGATEANNLALLGLAAAPAYAKKRHVVTVTSEHRAVLDPCLALEARGYALTRLAVDREGRLDLGELASGLRADTLVVSVMHANNETGVLHPLRAIGALCKARGVLFHCDATQSFGKEPIDVQADGIDLVSASAHKLHGPLGAGVLYVRHRGPHVRLAPLVFGGGQERGLRAGTLNTPALVGFGAAARIAREAQDSERARITALRDGFERALLGRVPGTTVNGGGAPRLATTTNLAFEGVRGRELVAALPELALSTAAACSSAGGGPSHVLTAMGLAPERVEASVRVSLGRFTTAEELARALELLAAAVEALRKRPARV